MKSKKSIIKKILDNDLVQFKIKVPYWLLGFIILMPLTAYFDITVIGKTTFYNYLGICFFELLLVYIGFTIAYNTK